MRGSGRKVLGNKIATMLEHWLFFYKNKRSEQARIKLANKVLESIKQLFDGVSLRVQQRHKLVMHMDKVLCALETSMTDTKDNDFMLSNKKGWMYEVAERKQKAMKLTTQIIAIFKWIDSDIQPTMAARLASVLADVGQQLHCEEEFNELKQFIEYQLEDDEDEDMEVRKVFQRMLQGMQRVY